MTTRDDKLYDEVERLANLAHSLGLGEDEFDDIVYDMAIEFSLDKLNPIEDSGLQEVLIQEASDVASIINNGGFIAQIDYLVATTPLGTPQQTIDYIESYIREYSWAMIFYKYTELINYNVKI